jgi:hypothetical protein
MIKQVAITVAGIGAAIALTVGLVAAGFGPRSAGADPAGTEVPAAPLTAAAPTAEPTLEPEIVYVKPAPAPKRVVVERQTAAGSTSTSRGNAQSRPVGAVRDDDHRYEREDHDEYERDDD